MEFEKLQQIIAEVLNIDPEEITMNTTFVDDLGADSLDVFQIIMGIEEEFDIEIPTEEAEKIASVGDTWQKKGKSNERKTRSTSGSDRLPVQRSGTSDSRPDTQFLRERKTLG